MIRIYISGRIKDYPEYEEHFQRVEDAFDKTLFKVVNPCKLGFPGLTYEEYMRIDLSALLECEAIYMLKGWERSAGARCEHLVAAMCGFTIYYEE